MASISINRFCSSFILRNILGWKNREEAFTDFPENYSTYSKVWYFCLHILANMCTPVSRNLLANLEYKTQLLAHTPQIFILKNIRFPLISGHTIMPPPIPFFYLSLGYVKCVEYLILIGGDVNSGRDQSTPLMMAVMKEDTAMVHLLLSHNPDNVKTTLQWCLKEEKWKLSGNNV